MKLKRLINILPCIDTESKERLQKIARPDSIGRKKTPVTLDFISYGQLIQLSGMTTDKDCLLRPCEVLLDIPQRKALRSDAAQVVGFSNFTLAEVKRITDLFKACRVNPSSEEKQAGIDSLDFGVFGVLDWYARRMGITDHDKVLEIGWLRVYNAMSIEKKREDYRRRLERIYNDKQKRL
jgi:hypothetical protein